MPAPLTLFVGREREVRAVGEALTTARLVTLTGAGGSGKTRVAAEVARSAADRFADGTAWVELAPVTDPDHVIGHIAATLGIGNIGQTPADALREALRDSELLLVLDNCEHVTDAASAVVDLLLHECDSVRILATSREALGVEGEHAWLLPVLSLPDAGCDLEAISESEAVGLFVERARAANRSFALTPANAEAVARLCRRLDGLPLAIELAAARARALTPEQMVAVLDGGLNLLGGARRVGGRHCTLRETIDWSYDLLDDREQRLLVRLSVFAGAFSLDAAEAVCFADDIAAGEVLDLIAALVDKSLVVVREHADEARYHLLETIRQYGRERLDASADGVTVEARHTRFYADLVREAEPHFITARRPVWVERIQRELDDVRTALMWTRVHDPQLHVELAGRLGWFWYSSGLWTEGRRRLEDALSLPDAQRPDSGRAHLLFAAGVLASLQGHGATARTWLEESSGIGRSLGDERLVAYSDSYIGVALGQEGLAAAKPPTRAALAWFESAGDLYGKRLALVVLATVLMKEGDLAAAHDVGDEAVRVARAYGLGRELGIALQVLAAVLLAQRDLAAASESIAGALRALREDPQPFWLARALELMGLVECVRGRPLAGARLFGAAEARRERIGSVMFRLDRDRLAPHIAAARASGDAEFSAAWSGGRALPFEDAVDVAIADAVDRSRPSPSGGVVPDLTEAASTAPALRVRALGALEIERDGVPLSPDAWKYAKPRELFVYLLVHPNGRTRDEIAADFWPDALAAQAKNSFHVMLHHLRRAIGADVVVYANETYRVNWSLGVELDATTFERDVVAALGTLRGGRGVADAARHLRLALDLYRGELLADEAAGDWHFAVRERLQRLWTDGLASLGAHYLAIGANDEAAAIYRRLVRAEELDEDAHRQLMTALSRSGHRGEALRLFDRLAHGSTVSWERFRRTRRGDCTSDCSEPRASDRCHLERTRAATLAVIPSEGEESQSSR